MATRPLSASLVPSWIIVTTSVSAGLRPPCCAVQKYSDPPWGRLLADLAASFQAAVVDVLSAKAARAAAEFDVTAVLPCGGVSANQALRAMTAERSGVPVHYSPPILCTDNAAMVGACAYQHFIVGGRAGWDLDVVPGLRLV